MACDPAEVPYGLVATPVGLLARSRMYLKRPLTDLDRVFLAQAAERAANDFSPLGSLTHACLASLNLPSFLTKIKERIRVVISRRS